MLQGPLLVLPFQARQARRLSVLELLTLRDLDQTLVCVDEVWIRRDGFAERGDGFVQLSGPGRGLTPVERRPGDWSAAAVARGEAGPGRGTDQRQHGSDENQSMGAHVLIVDPLGVGADWK